MNGEVEVLREFVGWWPLRDLELDGVPVTDGSTVELIALPKGMRPTDPVDGYQWKPGHVVGNGPVSVWLDQVDTSVRQIVYARPTPVDPEIPVYQVSGTILRT